MKCDTCKFKSQHSAGSIYDVVSGKNIPYAYDYCMKQGWNKGRVIDKRQKNVKDISVNCEFYEKVG